MPASGRLRARTGGLVLADQAISSLGTFALGYAALRALDLAGFGIYGLVLLVYGAVTALVRTLSSEVVAYAAHRAEDDAGASGGAPGPAGLARGSVTVAAGVASALAAGVALAAAVLPAARPLLAVLAIVTVPLVLQDAMRTTALALQRPRLAVEMDLAWTVPLLAGLAATSAWQGATLGRLLLLWGLTAAVSAVAGLRHDVLRPGAGYLRGWRRRHGTVYRFFLGEFAADRLATTATGVASAAILGITAFGLVRVGLFAVSPLNVVVLAAGAFFLPEAVRLAAVGVPALVRGVRAVGAGLVAVCALWVGAIVVAPPAVVSAVLGDVGAEALPLILWCGVAYALTCVILVLQAAIRGLGDPPRALGSRLLGTVAITGATLIGAAVGGALGTCVGSAAGTAVAAAVSAIAFLRAIRARSAAPV